MGEILWGMFSAGIAVGVLICLLVWSLYHLHDEWLRRRAERAESMARHPSSWESFSSVQVRPAIDIPLQPSGSADFRPYGDRWPMKLPGEH